jgi:hypothetical protein
MPTRTFRIGDAFPAGDKSAGIIRLLIAVRQMVVFQRCLTLPSSGESVRGSEFELEHRLFMILALASSAKEAADAFRSCDSEGAFRFVTENPALTELNENLAYLRTHLDKSRPDSLYTRSLKQMRDDTGWHWSRSTISSSLAATADLRVRAFADHDVSERFAVPLTRAVVSHAAFLKRYNSEEMKAFVAELLALQFHLEAIAHDVYFLLVRIATELE